MPETTNPAPSEDPASPSSGKRDGAKVRFPPPLLFALFILAGHLLEGYWGPLPVLAPFLDATPASVRFVLAALCGLTSVVLILWAGGLFQRSGQDPRPWLETPVLIAKGVFRLTRNPMYVAMALAQAAFGLGLANAWLLLLLPLSLTAVYFVAIRHEETYLEGKFGQQYLDYKGQVRRWL